MFQEIDYLFHSPKNQLIFQEIDYLFHSSKNQQIFREIHYLFHFSEKPTDISREISCFVSEQKLMFRNPVRRSIPDSVSDSGSANVR